VSQLRTSGNKRLRIVQVISNVPNARPLPPTNQGGTEKIVHELTEELVRRGHDVYLFAAKGSRSSAKLIPYPTALKNSNLGAYVLKKLPPMVSIIHDHTFSSALSRRKLRIPTVSTLHLPVRHWVQNPVYVSKRAKLIMGKKEAISYIMESIYKITNSARINMVICCLWGDCCGRRAYSMHWI
jgi:hypothetical protein